MYSKFRYSNNAVSAYTPVLTGQIFSDSVNYPSPYVGTTMRATAGELDFDDSNLDRVELDTVISLDEGHYWEFRTRNDASFDPSYNQLHNTTDDQRVGIGSSNFRIYYLQTSDMQIRSILFPISPNNLGEFYTHRLELNGGTITYKRNGIFIDSITLNFFSLAIDILGNKSDGSGKFGGVFDYIDFNGQVFNFNETGDDINVSST